MSEHSGLEISAHADRVDGEQGNLELSELRAKNTLQAIKDILGRNFAINANNETLRALGEQGAIDAGDPNDTKNPARRKSEVVLNSRLVVSLRGKR